MDEQTKMRKSEEHKEAGNNYFKRGQYELAIREYKKGIKYNETSILHSNIARCYLNMDQIQNCIDSWAFALSLNSTNFKAILMMGDCSVSLGQKEQNPLFIDQAETYYSKAVRICNQTNKGINIVDINK